jgi:hypothetical protein
MVIRVHRAASGLAFAPGQRAGTTDLGRRSYALGAALGISVRFHDVVAQAADITAFRSFDHRVLAHLTDQPHGLVRG